MTTITLLSAPLSLGNDLAGPWQPDLSAGQVQRRIATLIQRYVTVDQLRDRIADLPHQFHHPQPRPWSRISWAEIGPDQVSGMAVEVFCAIVLGSINTEAPIRGYTQAMVQKWRQPNLQGSLIHTLRRMTHELAWEQWGLSHRATFLSTFVQVMRMLWRWDQSLSQPYLEGLLGPHPAQGTMAAPRPLGRLTSRGC